MARRPVPTLVGETLDMPLSVLDCPLSPPGCLFQFAFLVADTEPQAPPTPAPGTPLQGVLALQAPGASGSVLAQPAAVVTGSGAGAQVWLAVDSLAQPLSSGAVLRAALRETYDLRDGSKITGTRNRRSWVAISPSPLEPCTSSPPIPARASRDSASASCNGASRHRFNVAERRRAASLIDNGGGTVNGPGGCIWLFRRTQRPGKPVDASPVAPASPAGGAGREGEPPRFRRRVRAPSHAGAARSAGGVRPRASGQAVTDGQEFVIGRLAVGDEGSA